MSLSRVRLSSCLACALALSAFAIGPAAAAPSTPSVERVRTVDFSGRWETTFGIVELSQRGRLVEGRYTYAGGATVTGRVDDEGVLRVRYVEPGARGEAWFALSPDGVAVAGSWRADGSLSWQPWTGVRAGDPRGVQSAAAACKPGPQRDLIQLSGAWESDYGPLTIRQRGTRVEGSYYGGAAHFRGELTADCLVVRYVEQNATGEAWFRVQDGRLVGRWLQEGGAQWNGWNAWRAGQGPGLDPLEQCLAGATDDGQRHTASFDGLWRTDWGTVQLRQRGARVSGGYDYGGPATLTGEVHGACLVFTYRDASGTGVGWFRADPSSGGFVGAWRADQGARWSPWNGVAEQPL